MHLRPRRHPLRVFNRQLLGQRLPSSGLFRIIAIFIYETQNDHRKSRIRLCLLPPSEKIALASCFFVTSPTCKFFSSIPAARSGPKRTWESGPFPKESLAPAKISFRLPKENFLKKPALSSPAILYLYLQSRSKAAKLFMPGPWKVISTPPSSRATLLSSLVNLTPKSTGASGFLSPSPKSKFIPPKLNF